MRQNNDKDKISEEKKRKAAELLLIEEAVSEELTRLIRSYDSLLALYIIKSMTGQEHAMSVPDITDHLNYLIRSKNSEFFPERTVRRKIEMFIPQNNPCDPVKEEIKKLLPSLIGGTVEYRAADGIEKGTNRNATGSQKRFYFEPVLSSSDLDMIYGVLMSSRYLSASEKDYLLQRLSILNPMYSNEIDPGKGCGYRSIDEITPLAKRPAKNKASHLPMDSSALLKHVQLIYDAIASGYRIDVVYGIYDIKEGSFTVDFHARNTDKPYVLNPYAMLWNDGEYYLVATHSGHDNPVHFRVDRILSVSAHTVTDDAGNVTLDARSPIPDSLKPYYKKEKSVLRFDGIKYANTYPGMSIYHDSQNVTCIFECTTGTLQVLVDNFGSNIRLAESDLPHSDDELDFNGRSQHFLTATVSGIQRENALLFCIEHARYLKLISPLDLVSEVKAELKRIAKEY